MRCKSTPVVTSNQEFRCLPCHDVYVQRGDTTGGKEVAIASLASDQCGNSSVPLLWLESRDTLVHSLTGGKGQTVSCSCCDSQAPYTDT